MPWFKEPNIPEPNPQPEEPAQQTAEVLTEEDRRKAWRLLALMDALRHVRPDEPISLDEIKQLGYVADGFHDLHAACGAIRNGCSLTHLVEIFT